MMGSQKDFTVPFGITLKTHLWVKNVANLIDARQISHVNERFVGESSGLIDDVIKVCDLQKWYLLTVDFEKACDSLNHKLLIEVFKKYCFGENFIAWIKI